MNKILYGATYAIVTLSMVIIMFMVGSTMLAFALETGNTILSLIRS